MALVLHSYSVMMDAIYDASELILMGPFLVLVPLLYKPVTEKRPYGYAQFESLFLIVKYGILLMVTILMIYSNIRLILSGGHRISFGAVAMYEMAVGLLSAAVYVVLRLLCREASSPTTDAELYLWKQDIAGSAGLTVAFASERLLRGTGASVVIPYLDSAVAIILAVLLMREPIRSLIRELRELVLLAPDEETMNTIRGIVDEALSEYGYRCSFLDVIRTGRKLWVEIYVAPDDASGMVNVRHWAEIRAAVRAGMNENFGSSYVELIPDIPEISS